MVALMWFFRTICPEISAAQFQHEKHNTSLTVWTDCPNVVDLNSAEVTSTAIEVFHPHQLAHFSFLLYSVIVLKCPNIPNKHPSADGEQRIAELKRMITEQFI